MLFDADIFCKVISLISYLFHTYLVSGAVVKVLNNSINRFTWIIDKSTIVKSIEEIDPSENSLF